MYRRQFVSLLCVGGFSSGCLSNDSSDRRATIDVINLRNASDSAVEFVVKIAEDESSVQTYSETVSAGSNIVFEEPVAQPGQYTVSVEAAGAHVTVDTTESISKTERHMTLIFRRRRGGDITTDVRAYEESGNPVGE